MREREVIEIFLGEIGAGRSPLRVGFDDAAAWEFRGKAVVNVDSMTESTDRLPGMTYRQFGRKSVVQGFSDVLAKGARPEAFMIAVGLKRGVSTGEVVQLARGVADGLRELGADFLGGDVGASPEVSLTSVAFGSSEHPVGRGGARPGDVVGVTGYFGWTWVGYRAAFGEVSLPRPLEERAIKAVMEPSPPLPEGEAVGELWEGISSSADSSDGLLRTLEELGAASRVGFEISWLPVEEELLSTLLEMGVNPVDAAFYGGEEYELVLTIRPEFLDEAVKAFESRGVRLMTIGRVIEGEGVWLREGGGGEIRRLRSGGWEHSF